MPLDCTRLQKTKRRGDKLIAQCPACAEAGGDRDGNHLAVFDSGAYACIVAQVDDEHRKRIFQLVGLPADPSEPPLMPKRAAPEKAPTPPLDWQACCHALARNRPALERLAEWRGWKLAFCERLPVTGVVGLHEGCVAFPVCEDGVTATAAHCFSWPGGKGQKAWYVNGGKNWPLVIGAESLAEIREVHVLESQHDALSLLHAKGWRGEPLDKPFVITRGTSIHPSLTERLAGVQTVTLWPQRDEVKAEGKAPPSEKWVQQCAALMPATVTTLRRVDTPEPHDDWNNVLRAIGPAETLKAIKAAVRAAADVPRPSPATATKAAFLPVTQSALSAKPHPQTDNADSADIGSGDSAEFEPEPPAVAMMSDDGEPEEAAETEEPFPLDATPEPMRSMIAEAARVSLAPDVLTGCCALAAVSAAIGGGLEVDSGGERRTRGNLYLLPVAASGTGKGTAFKLIMQPFNNAELDALFEWRERTLPRAKAEVMAAEARLKRLKDLLAKDAGTDEREKILQQLADADRELEAAKLRTVEPTWSTADCTREALEKLLAESPSETLASLSPEARGLVDVLCGRYHSGGKGGSSDESTYLSAYTGEPCKVHRKNSQPVTLKRPCLSVLWMLQPDKLRDMLGNVALTDSGMMPRFLFCNTRAEPMNEPEEWPTMNAQTAASWNVLIRELVNSFRGRGAEPLCIRTSDAVRGLFRGYFNEIVTKRRTGGELADVSTYAARWAENAWRLAVVLHAAEKGLNAPYEPMPRDTALNAIRLMQWFSRQQLSLLASGRHERQRASLDKLKAALQTCPDYRSTLRDLERRNGIERAEVEALAKAFPAVLVLEKLKTGKPGQPSEVARLLVADQK
jgi:Protein of unknown function (DUF3987)